MLKRRVNKKVKKKKSLYRIKRSFMDQLRLLLTIVLPLGAFVLFYHLIMNSPYLKLEQVELEGEFEYLDAKKIKSKIDWPLGKNIFAVNLHKIRKEIKKNSWIADLSLRRVLPNKLIVKLHEYRPFAVLELKDGEHYFMSEEGAIFSECDKEMASVYPLIKAFSRNDLRQYPLYYRRQLQMLSFFLAKFKSVVEEENYYIRQLFYNDLGQGEFEIVNKETAKTMRIYFGKLDKKEKIDLWKSLHDRMKQEEEFYYSVDFHLDGKVYVRKEV